MFRPYIGPLSMLFVLLLSYDLQAQIPSVSKLNTDNYDSFKVGIRPLIEEMANKRIVALGEGTHGTSEFSELTRFRTVIRQTTHSLTRIHMWPN